MERLERSTRLRLMFLLLALMALVNSGCLVVAAGAATGGAVGYAYYRGNVTRFYAANLEDVHAATRSALAELGMPIAEKNEDGGYLIDSRTADGDRVRLNLELQTSRIPAEGALTRVGVRVATFGDVPVSERILDQIGFHL